MITTQSRKPHRKVRTGCRVCKSRKIKCDENKPSCNNCIKHAVKCDIMGTVAIGTSMSAAVATPASTPTFETSTSPATPLNTLSPIHGTPLPTSQQPLPSLYGSPSSGFRLVDMELLHHYTTSTCFTMSSNPSVSTLWRVNVPQIGYSHEFIMRGILSLAALHVAHYKPEKRDFYINQAMMHYNHALPIATSMLSDINEQNSTTLYLFSTITLFFAIARPRKPSDFLILGDTDVADWVFLLRGLRSISEMSHETIKNGSLGALFTAGSRRVRSRDNLASHRDIDLENLQEFIRTTNKDENDVAAYTSSIDELQRSFSILHVGGHATFEMSDLFIWPYMMSDHYLALLRQRTQPALTIYAYYCVLLKYLDLHWWMKGWAEQLISQIWSLLDEEHRLWIRGPIEKIGWIPS